MRTMKLLIARCHRWLWSWRCWLAGQHQFVEFDPTAPVDPGTIMPPQLIRQEFDPAHPESPIYIVSTQYCRRCLWVPRP